MQKDICTVHGEMNETNAYKCKNPNGTFRLRCKECVRVQAVKRYETNRQVYIDNAAKWKKENRSRVRELASNDREKNPEKYKKYANDHYNKNPTIYIDRVISQGLGLTKDEYYLMIEEQKNLCAICFQPETSIFKGKVMRLCLDHDHDTGKVRQLLCRSCNTGIGKFKDSIELLQSAITYLKKHETV